MAAPVRRSAGLADPLVRRLLQINRRRRVELALVLPDRGPGLEVDELPGAARLRVGVAVVRVAQEPTLVSVRFRREVPV